MCLVPITVGYILSTGAYNMSMCFCIAEGFSRSVLRYATSLRVLYSMCGSQTSTVRT